MIEIFKTGKTTIEILKFDARGGKRESSLALGTKYRDMLGTRATPEKLNSAKCRFENRRDEEVRI